MPTGARLWSIAVGALLGATSFAHLAAADRIAYQGRLVIGSRGIIVMSGAGENPVELPHPATSDRITPALSPDGTMLAYAAKDGEAYKLWVVRLADDNSPVGEPTPVTTGDADDEQPAWSPDGQRLAYVSGTADKRSLFTIALKGGAPTQLVSLGADFRNACPHWSPDGSRIVFSSGGKLFVIAAEGGDTRQLTDDGMYSSWSPDGSRIAFFRLKPEPALCVIAPQGGEPRVILNNVDYFGETAWSPDGRSIAFKADKVNGVEGSLWVVAVAGGPAKALRSYGVAHGYLDWSGGPVRMAAAGATQQAQPAAPPPGAAGPAAAATAGAPQKSTPAPLRLKMQPPSTAGHAAAKTPSQPKRTPAKPVKSATPAASRAPSAAAKPVRPAISAPGGSRPAAAKTQSRLPAPAPIKAPAVKPTTPAASPAAANLPPIAASAATKPAEAPSQSPPVRIVSPADGATVRGMARVLVSKDTQEGYISFFVDGNFQEATIPPFEMAWDTGKVEDGPHTISVTGYSGTGAVQGQTQVRVEVHNAIGAESLPQEGVTLRYRYKDKEKWDYQVGVRAGSGNAGEISSPAIAAEVGSLDALITQRVESVRDVPVQPAGAGKSSGAKETPATPPRMQTIATLISQVRSGRLDAPGAQGILPQVGQAARSTRTLQGVVTTVEAPGAPEPIALGNLSVVFPDQAVKIGDKWAAPMTILPVLRSNAVARVNAEHTVDSVEWQQGLETIRIVSTFKAPSLPVGVSGMSLDNVTGTRVTWFAYKERRVVRMEDNIQGTFNQKAAVAAAAGPAQSPVAGAQPGLGPYAPPTPGSAPGYSAPPRPRGGFSMRLGGRRSAQPSGTTTPPRPGALRLGLGNSRAAVPSPQAPRFVPAQRVQPGSQPSPVFHYALKLVAALQK